MWWMLLAQASAGVGPFALEVEPKVFGTQPQQVEDEAAQGPVKILMAGREGDTLKVDGWPFGTLPVETELAAGLHRFRIEGEAGVVEIDAVVHVLTSTVVEIDLTTALPPPEPVAPTSVQGNKPQLASPSEVVSEPATAPEPETSTASTDPPG